MAAPEFGFDFVDVNVFHGELSTEDEAKCKMSEMTYFGSSAVSIKL